MILGFEFHPEARVEFVADIDRYDERFQTAVRAAIDAAVDSPEACRYRES